MIYAIAKVIFSFWFGVFNKFRIYGKENITADRPLIVYCNHFSCLDVFALNIAFGEARIRFMAKKELFSIPLVRWFVKKYGAFPVDRGHNDITAIKTALRVLKAKDILGIFPEGTRVKNPAESSPKGGFVMFAVKTGATLQPVRIVYKRRLQIFNSISMYIGKPITADQLGLDSASPEECTAVGEKLMKDIYKLNNENI